jgi:hypothetical protein
MQSILQIIVVKFVGRIHNASEQQPQIYLLCERKCFVCADAPRRPIAAVINNSKADLPGGRYTPNSSWNHDCEVKFVTNKLIDILFQFVSKKAAFCTLITKNASNNTLTIKQASKLQSFVDFEAVLTF